MDIDQAICCQLDVPYFPQESGKYMAYFEIMLLTMNICSGAKVLTLGLSYA